MPIGLSKAPDTLPKRGQQLWVDTFNGVFDSCTDGEKICDERAAKIAWSQVRKQYKKAGDKWVLKESAKSESEAYSEVELVITKATLQQDGTMRWQAVTSDTEVDKATERTSLALFRDWIERVDYGLVTEFLPDEPRMPFLGLSHYPALDDGSGEAGATARMFTDGNQFKAGGAFHSDEEHPIGPAVFESVRQERALIKKGEVVDNPIRISAGWWDLQHSHGEFIFNRKSLTDICPMCVKNVGDKVYLKGQLDHFAATRVPMNPRTSLELEEKSMATTTRVQDAASIIDPELAEELDRKAKLIGKADADTGEELPEGMAVRAGHKDKDEEDEERTFGDFLKSRRGKKKMSLATLAETTGIDERDITDFETNKRRPGKRMVDLLAEALGLDEDEMMDRLDKAGHKDKDKDKKHRKPMKADAEDDPDVERDEHGEASINMPPRPFGGATSIDEAEEFMEAQETLAEMHSNWDIFRMVISNILAADPEQEDDKVKAMSEAIGQFGQRINALKASLADAYLLQSAAVVDETPAEVEIIDEAEEIVRSTLMTEEIQVEKEIQVENQHPADVMKAANDATLANGSLNAEAKTQAIQEALDTYTANVNQQLERDDPALQAKAMAKVMAGALVEAMAPTQSAILEAVGLLNAKLGDQATQPKTVAIPQQKSFVAQPSQTPAQVGNQGQLPISPQTGKPSALTAAMRRSVGLKE